MDVILTYLAANPKLAAGFIIIAGISELLGSIKAVKENTVYEAVATAIKKVFTAFVTPVK